MIKPSDFWENVARDVSITANAMNSQVPLWDELDEAGQASLVLICQVAVKAAAKRGRALLPYEPADDIA
jgi:hypothetical protein